jgi:hypothetical protein
MLKAVLNRLAAFGQNLGFRLICPATEYQQDPSDRMHPDTSQSILDGTDVCADVALLLLAGGWS